MSLPRPSRCCDVGSYGCTVPQCAGGRRIDVDLCVADIVAALNAAGIRTEMSCCGHGTMDGVVELSDGRSLSVRFPGDREKP